MTSPKRVLAIVDAQLDYFEGPLEIAYPPRDESLANIVRAIGAAEAAGIPILVVQHDSGEGAPVFAAGTVGYEVHPDIARQQRDGWKWVTKRYSSIYEETGVREWMHDQGIDTITLVGYMTNNCILSSAASAESSFTTETLSDATGAVNLANRAGHADARTVHETIMTVLDSNWSPVATTSAWLEAVAQGVALPTGDLGSSAVEGRARATTSR
jgi:nicotinamidase-related amidase